MNKNANKPPAYRWSYVKEKLLNGVTYATGNPFQYRYQLRLKVTSNSLVYTFWDFNKCVHAGVINGVESSLWEQFDGEIHRRGMFEIPCVSVCASIWSEMPILLRPDANASVPLDIVNKGLREQPDKIRRDLQVNGLYGFTAMPCDSSKIFIFGVPLGYALKGALAKLPKEWAKASWYGPTAIPPLQREGTIYHTILLKQAALSMLVQDGKLRFLQQDRALIEDQPISQGSLARLKSVYAYFSPGQIKHLLHPVDVKMAWVSTLKACIQGMGIASDVQIAGPSKFKVPGIPDNTLVQDMFPTGLPWS